MGKPLVSICCITYNHEPYIKDALDGFVMQKTNFPYEIVISDDCSKDGTRKIIEEYKSKYPGLIRDVSPIENKGMLENFAYVQQLAEGKYMAWCEGDDYWPDPSKLQKQVDFLESHSEYDLCCSASKVYNQSKQSFVEIKGTELCESYETCIQGINDINTASVLVRQTAWQKCLEEISSFLPKDLIFDTAYWYWFAYHKKTKYMPEPMAVYRVLENSACHTTDPKVETWMQWRFLRLKLYFLLRYPLREKQEEVTKSIITEIEQHAKWNQYCAQRKVRNSKTYRLGSRLLKPFKKLIK